MSPNVATPTRVAAAAIAALSLSAGVLMVHSAQSISQTSDEAVHLAAGVSYWQTGDRRINPEHPPLAKMWAALPVVLSGAKVDTSVLSNPAFGTGDRWAFGQAFLYAPHRDIQRTLLLGRLPIIALAMLLIALAGALALSLHGPPAGILAAALTALDPNLLAHGRLITTDTPLALFWLATVAALVRFRRTRRLEDLLLCGALLGAALATKFTAALLVPLVPIGLAWPHRHRLRPHLWPTLRASLQIGAVAAAVITLVYGGNLLAFFDGATHLQHGWKVFLLGEISTTGWLYYFVVILAVLTPWAALLLLGWASATLRRLPLQDGEGLLLASALLLFGVASLARVNIGIRHILPVLPILWIFASRLLSPGLGPHLRRAPLVIAATLLVATESLACHPFYLAHFSPAFGGAQAAPEIVSDSNLDWGQGLLALSQWSAKNSPNGLYLAYFGNAPLSAYGLRAQPLPGFGPLDPREPTPLSPQPPLFVAISLVTLQGVYLDHPNRYAAFRALPTAARIGGSIALYDLRHSPDAALALANACRDAGWERTARAILKAHPPKPTVSALRSPNLTPSERP